MGLEKNFVVKKGIEVATDLIFADIPTNRVGVGTTVPSRKLDVNGDFQAVGDARVTGITTVDGKLDIGVAGTAFRVATGTKKVGINTQLDASLFDFEVVGDVGFSTNLKVGGITTSTMAHVVGLTSTMDLHVLGLGTITDARVNAGFVTVSYTDTDDLLVSIAGTFARVDINSGDIDVQTIDVGVCTVSRVDINSGDVDINTLEVVGVSTIVNSFIDRNTVGIETVTGFFHVTGTSEFDGDVKFDGTYDIIWDKSESAFEFGDNAKATFGTDNDLQIFHNGEDSYIDDTGTGSLYVRSNEFQVRKNGSSEKMITASADNSVELYYDNSKKLETLGTGVTVTGRTYSSNFSLPDNGKYYAGNQDDLQIYHNGTSSYIDNDKGSIYIRSNVDGDDGGNIYLQAKSGENGVTVNDDGSVQLYHNNILKLSTDTEGVNITNVLDVATQLNTTTLKVSSGSTFTGNVRLEANLDLQDNDKILIGTGDDLQIFHNGDDSYIDDTGTGSLYVRSNEFQVRKAESSEKMITATADNSVELYYDDSKKLETLGTGVTVTGTTQSSDFSVPDNGRYYAGNGNDLSLVHDGTDSLLINDTGNLYLRNGIGSTNQIYIQAVAGTTNATFQPDGRTITTRLETSNLTVSSASTFTGNVRLTANLDLQDNDKILIGTGDDLKIYHDSNNSYIDDAGTGSLFVRSNEFQVRKAESSEKMITATADNSVDLWFNNSNKLQTTNVGVNVTGTIESDGVRVNDNDTISAGTDQDLSIYHNGTDSYIDNNTGSIYIRSNVDGDDGGNIYLQAKSGENGIIVNDDSTVALYNNGLKKFETKTTGADVTGTLTTDDLDVSGTVTAGVVTSVGAMTVVGDLFAGSFRGDGSLLTGIDTSGNFQGKTIIGENLYIPVGIATVGNVVLNNPVGTVNATSVTASNATFTGNVISGSGSGGVALTVNDGYGNANVTFNHAGGIPEQNGNSARIEHNSDSSSNSTITFGLKSGVTANTVVAVSDKLTISETAVTATSGVVFTGDGSGLTNVDSETIDGLNSSDFIRSNANDNVTGHTEWQDNYSARFGNDADLRIYHSGADAYIDNNTRHIYIRSNVDGDDGGNIYLQAKSGENSIIINDDGGVSLWYNNTQRLTTNTVGVEVTGTLTATLFSGSGASLTSIPNGALNNSTISGIALGSNLQTLTRGSYLTGSNYNGSTARTWAVDATSGNTASKVVARDSSGNFSAGTITASLSGTALNATNFNVASDNSTNATHYITFTGGATGNQRPNSDTGLTWNPSTNTLTAANFNGNATTATNATNAGTVDGLNASSFIRSDADDNVTGHTEWQDNKQVRLGNGADFGMRFDGADTYFRNYAHANGDILFQGENSSGTNQNILIMKTDGTRTYNILYENSQERLRTTSSGITVTGTVTATEFSGNMSSATNATNASKVQITLSDGVNNNNARLCMVDDNSPNSNRNDNILINSNLQYQRNTGTLTTTNLVTTGNVTSTGIVITNELRNRSGQQLVLNVGESASKVSGQTGELLYVNAEFGLSVNTPDRSHSNWESGYTVDTTVIRGDAIFIDGNTVWHSGNHGAGSGLDADKLDNLSSASFLRSDANDTASGELTFNGRVNIRGNIDLSDGENLDFGNSDDIRINYNGSNNWLYTNFRSSNGIVFQDNGADKIILEDSGIIRPSATNTGYIGTSSRYWYNGFFQDFNISSTLNVRGAIDLADSDVLRFGSSDDIDFNFNSNGWFYVNMKGNGIVFRDNGSDKIILEDSGIIRPSANLTGNLGTSTKYWASAYIGLGVVQSASNQLLLHNPSHETVIHRNDGNNYYIMMSTAGANPSGTWTTLRPFYINTNSGKLSSENSQEFKGGTSITDSNLLVESTAGNVITLSTKVGNGNDSTLILRKSRGGTNPSQITAGDDLGEIRWDGYDSNSYNTAAYIKCRSSANTGDFNASMIFGVGGVTSVLTSAGFAVGGTLSGNGSGLTSLNASNISSGTIADDRLPTTISRGSNLTFEATGDRDFNIRAGDNLILTAGTSVDGCILFRGSSGTDTYRFAKSGQTSVEGFLSFESLTDDRLFTFPNVSGTVALTSSTVSNATNATNFNVAADNSTNATHYVTFTNGATGNQRPNSDTGLTYNPSSNTLTAAKFAGNATSATNATNAANATNATNASKVQVTLSDGVNNNNARLCMVDDNSPNSSRVDDLLINSNLSFNRSTGALTSTSFVGSLNGNASSASSATNADKVDNLHASSFIRSDTNDTATGIITFNGEVRIRSAIDLADNDVLRFGTGDDVEFFCNGSHMYTDLNSNIGNWYIRDGSTTRFTFDDAGHFTATGNINSNSDIRLKDNIETLEGSLDKVKQLRGVEYDRIDSDEKFHQLGVIAQEIEKVYPDMVDEGEDGMKTVSYQQLIPVLIEAVKELSQEVDNLKSILNK